MLIAQTKNTNSISSVLLILFFWLINVGLCTYECFENLSNGFDFPLIKLLLVQLSILATAAMLNKMLQQHKLVGVGDALSGVLFLIFIMGIREVHEYYREFISLCLITLGNQKLIGLYNVKKNYLKEFEIGILFAFSILISPNLFLILGMMFIGLALVVPFSLRDFCVVLLGCLWIFFLKYTLLFIMDAWKFDFANGIYFSIPKVNGHIRSHHIYLLLLFLFEAVLFVSVFSVLTKRSIKERVFYWLWIWTFIFPLFSLTFFQKSNYRPELVAFLGLPCSVFSVEYFLKKGKKTRYWIKDVLVYSLIVIQVFLRVY